MGPAQSLVHDRFDGYFDKPWLDLLWESLLATGGFPSAQSKDPNLVAGCYVKLLYDTMRELANACPAVLREDCIKNYCQVVFWQQCQNFMLKASFQPNYTA